MFRSARSVARPIGLPRWERPMTRNDKPLQSEKEMRGVIELWMRMRGGARLLYTYEAD
jgi:hypothetical protein